MHSVLEVAYNMPPPSTLGVFRCPPWIHCLVKSLRLPRAFMDTPEAGKDVYVWNVKNWAPLQNHQVLKSTSVWNNQVAEAACFSWHFLGNCKESGAGSWGTEKSNVYVQALLQEWEAEQVDSLSCCHCHAPWIAVLHPKRERHFLDVLPAFQKLPKLCQSLTTMHLYL